MPFVMSPKRLPNPRNWLALMNEGMEERELKELRICAQRGQSYGALDWVTATAGRLGLEFALRNPGLPRKVAV